MYSTIYKTITCSFDVFEKKYSFAVLVSIVVLWK